jgi:hypothetical protein
MPPARVNRSALVDFLRRALRECAARRKTAASQRVHQRYKSQTALNNLRNTHRTVRAESRPILILKAGSCTRRTATGDALARQSTDAAYNTPAARMNCTTTHVISKQERWQRHGQQHPRSRQGFKLDREADVLEVWCSDVEGRRDVDVEVWTFFFRTLYPGRIPMKSTMKSTFHPLSFL